MDALQEITSDEVVEWAKMIREEAYKAYKRNVGRYIDYSEAVKFVGLAFDVRSAGKATDAGWLKITPCHQWLQERAKDDDKLGSLCSDFLNRTGLY